MAKKIYNLFFSGQIRYGQGIARDASTALDSLKFSKNVAFRLQLWSMGTINQFTGNL